VDVASNSTPNERGIAIENTHDVIPDCGDGVNTTQSSRVNTPRKPARCATYKTNRSEITQVIKMDRFWSRAVMLTGRPPSTD
jgi:hypothetical protein